MLLFEVLRMAMHQPLLYEKFSHTRLVTTVRPSRAPDAPFYQPEGLEDSETYAATGRRERRYVAQHDAPAHPVKQ